MNSVTSCPVCQCVLNDYGTGNDSFQYDCPNCGKFILLGTTRAMLHSRIAESNRFAAVLSHALRRMQKANEWPTVPSNTLKRIEEESYLPNPAEQAENLILYLGDKSTAPGEFLELHSSFLRATVGGYDEANVQFIVRSMIERGLVDGELVNFGALGMLSYDGWTRYNDLKRRTVAGTQAFMAMGFGNQSLTTIFYEYFKPAVKRTGFNLVRLDEEPKAGSIDERLRVEIRRSRFVVADLTDANPGAYWEAGFCEGLGRPVIYTCEASVFRERGTHFDTNHMHTVLWNQEEPRLAADELAATIRATMPDEAKMND